MRRATTFSHWDRAWLSGSPQSTGFLDDYACRARSGVVRMGRIHVCLKTWSCIYPSVPTLMSRKQEQQASFHTMRNNFVLATMISDGGWSHHQRLQTPPVSWFMPRDDNGSIPPGGCLLPRFSYSSFYWPHLRLFWVKAIPTFTQS